MERIYGIEKVSFESEVEQRWSDAQWNWRWWWWWWWSGAFYAEAILHVFCLSVYLLMHHVPLKHLLCTTQHL